MQGFARVAPDVMVRVHPFAYSGLSAEQLRQGAPADLFISADMAYRDALREVGLVPLARPIARNRLCLAARAGLSLRIRRIDDLGRAGLPLVVPPAESDPLGQCAAKLFERAG